MQIMQIEAYRKHCFVVMQDSIHVMTNRAGLPKHMRCYIVTQMTKSIVLQTVRGLVKSGQLQFINGGWSMHDEACTHYVSMIENTVSELGCNNA